MLIVITVNAAGVVKLIRQLVCMFLLRNIRRKWWLRQLADSLVNSVELMFKWCKFIVMPNGELLVTVPKPIPEVRLSVLLLSKKLNSVLLYIRHTTACLPKGRDTSPTVPAGSSCCCNAGGNW